jgi:hypothetical protein
MNEYYIDNTIYNHLMTVREFYHACIVQGDFDYARWCMQLLITGKRRLNSTVSIMTHNGYICRIDIFIQ